MFTINEIKEAHSKVKSGADYPAYVQALKKLGVKGYTTFVQDTHTEYYGADNFNIATPAGAVLRQVADHSDKTEFVKYLAAHQRGETTFPTFCDDSAKTGVEKWVVDMGAMTCTYFDKNDCVILEEKIPQPEK